MSARVRRNISAIKLLGKAKPKLRKAVLVNSDSDLVLALTEVISNVLQGNVHLNPAQKKKLDRYKSTLRKIAAKSTKLVQKRQLIVQKGGFLPTLLVPALGLLATIITEVL